MVLEEVIGICGWRGGLQDGPDCRLGGADILHPGIISEEQSIVLPYCNPI